MIVLQGSFRRWFRSSNGVERSDANNVSGCLQFCIRFLVLLVTSFFSFSDIYSVSISNLIRTSDWWNRLPKYGSTSSRHSLLVLNNGCDGCLCIVKPRTSSRKISTIWLPGKHRASRNIFNRNSAGNLGKGWNPRSLESTPDLLTSTESAMSRGMTVMAW